MCLTDVVSTYGIEPPILPERETRASPLYASMSDAQPTEERDREPIAPLDQWIDDPVSSLIRRLTDGSIPETPAEAATIDDVFEVLTEPAQRYILTYLLRSEGEITITALVDYVVTETDYSTDGEEFRNRVTTELTTTHLPALVDRGFVEYNMERQLVRPSETTAQVEPYLKIALAQQRTLLDRES